MDATERRNFWLCVGNGSFGHAGMAFFAFDTIMAGLVFTLTGSTVLVTLLTSTVLVGWLWPQLLVGHAVGHWSRKMPAYRYAAVVRIGAHAAMIPALYIFQDHPLALFWVLWLCTLFFVSAGGVSLIPFLDIVGKAIPAGHRSMLMGYRRLFGGLGGFLGGLVAVYVLTEENGFRYPFNYALLLGIGLALCTTCYCLFMCLREPEGATEDPRLFTRYLKDGMALFKKDADFRRFYIYRIGFHGGTMAYPLFVPFAMHTFNAPEGNTGWFAATTAITAGVSSMVWGRVAQRFGEAFLFRVCTALLLIPPCLALVAGYLAHHPTLGGWMQAHYLGLMVFTFACHIAAINGTGIAGTVYLLGLPPEGKRPAYLAIMNTLSTPLVFMPVLAGVLASKTSYETAFLAGLLVTVFATVMAWRLRDQE